VALRMLPRLEPDNTCRGIDVRCTHDPHSNDDD